MRVAILFDDVASRPQATPDERAVLEAVEGVQDALVRLGHGAILLPAGSDLASWPALLRQVCPDLVVNLCEGLGGRSEGEILAARVVEEIGFPMTGSPSRTLALARRKDQVNALLEEKGLPVPHWGRWNGFDRLRWAKGWNLFPAIVKPAGEDGSVGITQASVVADSEALARQLEAAASLAPLLVQAFVGTREINVGIVGDEILPLAEIVFSELPGGFHPMVGYEAKWAPGSEEDRGTRPVCPAPLSPEVAEKARRLAQQAWRAVGGQGYGRVDLRLTEPDILHVLEVNPNPDLAPTAGLARMAEAHGWDFPALVKAILARSLAPGAGTTAAESASAPLEVAKEVPA